MSFSIKEKPFGFENLLEFNFGSFIKWLVKSRKLINVCYYVGAIRTEKNNSKSFKLYHHQRKLVGLLRKSRIEVSLGYILKTDGYHEKGVDVQIAVDLLIGAYEDLWDAVVLLSSDTDLLPAIRKVRQLGKKVEYIGFSHNPSFAMIRYATLSKLLMPDEILPFVKK